MILVAGGSGRLGTEVVRRLLDRGQSVRVLTRDARRASALASAGAEVAVADVRDPATLPPAMTDVATVVSAVQGFAGPGRVTPASVDRDGNLNLIRAAGAAGAHVVLMSVVGAGPTHPMELFRMKAAAEDALRGSGVDYTIVRATAFAQLWREILDKGPRPVILGRGNNPINFVEVSAVADAVITATVDPGMRGRVVEITGPLDLTLNELALQVRPGKKPVHVSPTVLRFLATAAPAPVRRQAAAALAMDSYDMGHRCGSPETTGLEAQA